MDTNGVITLCIKMEIKVKKITNEDLLHDANSFTTGKPSKMTLAQCYRAMHSNIRTQIFWVECADIPLFVASQLVRSHVGVQFFQKTHRPDRNLDAKDEGRMTPTDISFIINAEAIINMSRKRLCAKASAETRQIWESVLMEVAKVDPDLVKFCVKPCVEHCGICREHKPCGYNKSDKGKNEIENYKKLFEK